MQHDSELRNHLLTLLKGGNAHMTFLNAVQSFPEKYMNTLFPNGTYSSWDLLEHIRRTQWDILDFMINPEYTEQSWPDDYWPPSGKQAKLSDWQKTIAQYQKDSEGLQKIVKDKQTDLFAKISHGDKQTILREIMLVCDHNAYHIGEFAIMRQVMKTWDTDHE